MASSSSPLPRQRPDSIHATGFTVLSEPDEGKAIVDIVFVHGLGGHAKNTWTSKLHSTNRQSSVDAEGSSREKRSRGLRLFFSKQKTPDTVASTTSTNNLPKPDLFWPLDLLPQACTEARILTWGYNSKVSEFFGGSVNQGTIFSHARDLLGDLTRVKWGSAVKNKPPTCLWSPWLIYIHYQSTRQTIFVAHSLGGIIVKAMLNHASESIRLREKAIYDLTYAILFLGTPHRGSNMVELGNTVRSIVSAVGFDTARQNVRDLAIDSAALQDVHDRFLTKLDRDRMIEITTFQEAHGMKGTSIGGLNQKVVEDFSSTCSGTEVRFTIDANHVEMCRYSSQDDDGYRRVSGTLQMNCNDIQHKAEETAKKQEASNQQQLNKSQLANIDSLIFPEMNDRQRDVLKTSAESCTWIHKHENFQKWQKDDHGLLWIQGGPGSGKSTLMKRIFDVCSTTMESSEQINLSFYFHRRGSDLQYSLTGMFRTLLHQLLDKFSKSEASFLGIGGEFVRVCEEKKRYQGDDTKAWKWDQQELSTLLKACLLLAAKSRPILIFIDALDEAGLEEGQSVVSYLYDIFEELPQPAQGTKICFACRNYPIIRTDTGLCISVDKENFVDISAYAHSELRKTIRLRDGDSEPDQLSQLAEMISRKASGVFLWIRLIIPKIAKQYNDGKSQEEILEELEKAPQDLSVIFREVLTLANDGKFLQTLHLMQWVCLARYPLSVTELRFALAMDDSSVYPYQELASNSKRYIDSDMRMKSLIVSLSGGLAEVISTAQSGQPTTNKLKETVQFIHQSINDFLLREGFQWLGEDLIGNAIGRGHDRLVKCCINYLKLGEVEKASSLTGPVFESASKELPFLRYSVGSWLLHAEKAENLQIPQEALIDRFQWPTGRCFYNWTRLKAVMNHHYFRLLDTRFRTTLLHVAAASNLASIVTKLLTSESTLEVRDVDGNTALHKAASGGHKEIVLELLSAGADINATNRKAHTPLACAGVNGHTDLVKLLIQKGAEVDQNGSGNALRSAARAGHYLVVLLLLENGADVNAQSGAPFSSALYEAVDQQHEAVIKLLIDHGACIDGQSGDFGTALQLAVFCGYLAVVKLLLDRGADMNAQCYPFVNAFQTAVFRGQDDIVRLMYEQGFKDVNMLDPQGRSVLQVALRRGHSRTAKLLLSLGAIPDWTSRDLQGCAAIHFAASGGDGTSVELVLRSYPEVAIDMPDTQGWTALHWAYRKGNVETIQLLIAHGADLQSRTAQSWTPSEIGKYCKDEYVVVASSLSQSTKEHDEQSMLRSSRFECSSCWLKEVVTYFCQECSPRIMSYHLCFRCILDAKLIHDPTHHFKLYDYRESIEYESSSDTEAASDAIEQRSEP